MKSRPLRLALYWFGGILLCLLIGYVSVTRWMQQAESARERLLEHQRQSLEWDREQLDIFWEEKIEWFPSFEAPLALAVMPSSRFNDFDAIYTLFRDDQGVAVLTLTQIGGYYNLNPLSMRRWQGGIERELSAEEVADLQAMIELLEQRLELIDPFLKEHGWNENVLLIARDLYQRQTTHESGQTTTTSTGSIQ